MQGRQGWGSRLGVILAVAGSAVGLGNFLRFPAQAAQNGGGAFLIPYLVALVLVGIPLMWVEWTIGRYGGHLGHGTGPGIFHNLSDKRRFFKYFGVIGVFGPMVIFFYYLYVESWLLGYVWHSLTEGYRTAVASGDMKSYFGAYTGMAPDAALFKTVSVWGFQVPVAAYVAFLATFALNFWILARGVKGGIEVLSKYGMPILLLLAVGMTIWALSLGAPDPKHPEASVWNGMGFLWNPDLSRLGDFKVWMAATGQVLFTLSVGMGCIITYASYLRRQQDVVLSGLTSASTNTFVEVILGGSLVIPIAFAFLGPQEILSVASSGSFNLGFVTMPLMLGQVPMATLLALAWFALLFIAGVTSSVSMVESGIAFLQDELGWSRRKTVAFWAVVSFVLCQPAILGFAHGVVDEMDFWAGTLGLVVFALVEVILFAWVFGIDKAWDEMHHGAEMRVPEIYKFVLKYITPVFLGTVLVVWAWQQGLDVLLMTHVAPADQPWVLATRIGLVVFFVALAWVARRSLKQRDAQGGSV